MRPTFSENAVVLTGAASGIGYELALMLAGQGAWLALGARRRDKLDAVAELCRERGGRAIAVPADVRHEAECRRLIDAAVAEYAGFFDTLRIELLGSGVTVTMIYPDFVATETRERALGPDGQPIGESPVHEGKVMSAEACARQILGAMARLLGSARGKLGMWLQLVAPGLIDRIALRAIRRGR